MDRRTRVEDVSDELEMQTYNLYPDRYNQLYGSASAAGDVGEAFGGEPEIPVTDPGDLNSFYDSLGSPRSMSGGQALNGTILGFAEGQGRRV